jgi:hypothetical protein
MQRGAMVPAGNAGRPNKPISHQWGCLHPRVKMTWDLQNQMCQPWKDYEKWDFSQESGRAEGRHCRFGLPISLFENFYGLIQRGRKLETQFCLTHW